MQESFYVDSNNILEGKYTSYYSNGNISKEGDYSKSKPIGTWNFYFQSGQLKSKGLYTTGSPNGHWIYYFENGGIRMQGPLVNNVKEGNWQHNYENGQIKNQGAYKNGVKEGQWIYNREDGTFKAECDFKEDNGVYVEYYESGEIKMTGNIVKGKSTGYWRYFHENGNLKAEGKEENGLKESEWIFYYESGEPKSKGSYEHGKSQGEWEYFHRNGQIEAIGTQDGKDKTGYWKMFFATGERKAEANYDTLNGTYREYYQSGKQKVAGQFKNGNHDGVWNFYYEDGDREATCNYSNGVGIYKSYYKKSGKIHMEGTLENGERVGDWKLYNKDEEVVCIYSTFDEEYGSLEQKYSVINDTTSKNRRADLSEHILKPKQARKPRRKINYPNSPKTPDIIVSTNPIAPLVGELPISVEYYAPNKNSHQIDFAYLKSHFFKSESSIRLEELYNTGFKIDYRFKNYKKSKTNGKPYFGHEARLSSIWHAVNISDSLTGSPSVRETKYEYAALFGSRNFFKPVNKHLTSEIYLGMAVGYRTTKKNWGTNAYNGSLFGSVLTDQRFLIAVRLGFSIGYKF